MDKVDDSVIERIQQKAFSAAQSLLPQPVQVLFYDCTTLYFESFQADELRAQGFSKDGKHAEVQVLLALLCTPEGLPVGYQLWPGNTFEGHTLPEAIEQIEKHYSIEQLVFTADSGLLSRANIAYLQERGHHYVLGARLKSLNQQLKGQILDNQGYKDMGEGYLVKEIEAEGKRLVVSYSPNRARKDAHERKEALEKLKKKLGKSKNPASMLSNFGYKKYLKVEGDAQIEEDPEKVAAAAQWDGLLGVWSNAPGQDYSGQQLLERYRGLWQIEGCFRVGKTDMRLRPIYHWTPRRIKAHIAICFMALVCMRYLAYYLKVRDIRMSEAAIRKALNQVQVSILKHQKSGERYGIPSRKTPEAQQIYKALGLKLSDIPFPIA